MHIEIESAVKFLVNELAQRLGEFSEATAEVLKARLAELLSQRFENHWYPEKPLKGSAYRCVNISIDDGSVDSVLLQAGEEVGISKSGLMVVFPKGLALWIDPNDVSCRLGKGAIFPIFRKIADQKMKASAVSVTGPSVGQMRPQQRPRSISPPLSNAHYYNSYQQQKLHQQTRPRSTTPPGFGNTSAGQMYQQTVRKNHSLENLHKLWDTIPNTTSYVPTSAIYQSPAVSTSRQFGGNNNYHHQQQHQKPDTVYSFNQYSSYYNSSSMKKKYTNNYNNNNNTYHKQPQKSSWQSDEIYNKYHWSRSEKTVSPVSTFNSSPFSYSGYSAGRHAQEVC